MPELPEVGAMAERLHEALVGKVLAEARPLNISGLKTFEPDPVALTGLAVEQVSARGKYCVIGFAGGYRLAFHLSQAGRVDLEVPARATRPKVGVVRFTFTAPPALASSGASTAGVLVKEFGTERKAGWWVLGPGDDGPLARLGPDPFSDDFATWVATTDDPRRVHTALRDQRSVAGIGRGFADDICHAARLSPYATLRSLTPDQRSTLVATTRDLLTRGLVTERRRTGGLPTKLGERFVVHGRHGTPCPTCGDEMRRVSYESYEVTYCPTCQTGGKVLADRRMSRLIR